MTLHYSEVVVRDGTYYLNKEGVDMETLVTARVLYFSENGNLECDFNVKDGVFEGIQKLYKDAYYQLSSEENYKNGVPDGISKFYRDGKLFLEKTYQAGTLTSEEQITQ
jgi:antitoxin component YwqK of YwqJK toxin-antitoxin module